MLIVSNCCISECDRTLDYVNPRPGHLFAINIYFVILVGQWACLEIDDFGDHPEFAQIGPKLLMEEVSVIGVFFCLFGCDSLFRVELQSMWSANYVHFLRPHIRWSLPSVTRLVFICAPNVQSCRSLTLRISDFNTKLAVEVFNATIMLLMQWKDKEYTR